MEDELLCEDDACLACEKAATAERLGEADGLANELERVPLEMDEYGGGSDGSGGGCWVADEDVGRLGIGRFGGGAAGRALAAEERRRWERRDEVDGGGE